MAAMCHSSFMAADKDPSWIKLNKKLCSSTLESIMPFFFFCLSNVEGHFEISKRKGKNKLDSFSKRYG
jgi:hypothetical protein